MIPKIIHYCWLSEDPFPEKIKSCIESWKRILSDYQIVHWDLTKLKEINSKWALEAYEAKKYAFAADFIRCFSVYHYGGIYLDSDVEVCKSLTPLLDSKSFMGLDSNGDLEAAVFGAEKNAEWLKNSLEFYSNRTFINPDGTLNIITMPEVFKKFISHALIDEVKKTNKSQQDSNLVLYPKDYFSPKDYTTGSVKKTKNTFAIHHFEGSWLNLKGWEKMRHNLKILLSKFIGGQIIRKMSHLINSFYKK